MSNNYTRKRRQNNFFMCAHSALLCSSGSSLLKQFQSSFDFGKSLARSLLVVGVVVWVPERNQNVYCIANCGFGALWCTKAMVQIGRCQSARAGISVPDSTSRAEISRLPASSKTPLLCRFGKIQASKLYFLMFSELSIGLSNRQKSDDFCNM